MLDTVQPQYPIVANAQMVDEESVKDFMETLFSRVFWKPNHFINLRGIGEKGTGKEGVFHHDEWIQPGLEEFPDDHLSGVAIHHVKRWSQHHVAAFVVPAVMKAARGTAENVDLMTCVVVDLDTGDTNAKATWIEQHIGRPTMAVLSGGITDAGAPKLHLYWVLDEPEADIGAVVEARHILAEKVGGDLQFGRGVATNPLGRAHQPIRIGGSVHAKHGRAAPVRLRMPGGDFPDFHELYHRIRNAPNSPWYSAGRQVVIGYDFGPTKNLQPMEVEAMLTEPVVEGGEGDRSRWSMFNKVAGFHIGVARRGELTLEQAKADTHGWMLSKMAPPWPDARFDREWQALLNRDVAAKGEMKPVAAPTVAQLVAEPEKIRVERRLENWATHLWTQKKAAPREFLVQGLIMAKAPHLFVAEGGAGKTFAALDLALKVASRGDGEAPVWMGMPVLRSGTAVVITTEDDQDELHLRLEEIDPEGRRFEAGRRLIVMPTTNSGGGFTMVSRQRDGSTTPSRDWAELLAQLRQIPDLALVVVDTLNTTLHGSENDSIVINEYLRELQPVCGELRAALVMTHHIKKQNNQAGGVFRPIATAEDMHNSIRGSSALPSNVRVVLGMWHSHDFAKRMKAMGLEPRAKQLWRFGVLKANNPEMVEGLRFLMRDAHGLMEDVTDRAVRATAGLDAQHRAWLEAAVKLAALQGYPFKALTKNSVGGVYARRQELHPCLSGRDMGPDRIDALVKRLIDERVLVVRQVAWTDSKRRTKDFPTLDVRGGPFTAKDPPRVDPEAAFEPPEWEADYRFEPGEGVVMPMDAPRFLMGHPDQKSGDTQIGDLFVDQ